MGKDIQISSSRNVGQIITKISTVTGGTAVTVLGSKILRLCQNCMNSPIGEDHAQEPDRIVDEYGPSGDQTRRPHLSHKKTSTLWPLVG